MQRLFDILSKDASYKQIREKLLSNHTVHVNGLWGSSWAYLTGAISRDLQAQNSNKGLAVLLITESAIQAEECFEDINLFLGGCAMLLPPLEVINDCGITDDYSRNVSLMERTNVLHRLMSAVDTGKSDNKDGNCANNTHPDKKIDIIVASVNALMQHMPPPETIESNTLVITTGDEHSQEKLAEWMTDRNFEHVTIVESEGEFSVKGCIMDIFPYSADIPNRIEFFGDEIESIRGFDPDTQLSTNETDVCRIVALKNNDFDQSSTPETQTPLPTILTFLPEEAVIVLKDETAIKENACSIIQETGMEGLSTTYNVIEESINKFRRLYLSTALTDSDNATANNKDAGGGLAFGIKSLEDFNLGLDYATRKLREISSENRLTIIFCNNDAEQHRFRELFGNEDAEGGNIELRTGRINKGFQSDDLGIALFSYNEVFKRYTRNVTPKPAVKARPIETFLDLQKGDLVVHVTHGVARFLGIKGMSATTSSQNRLLSTPQDSTLNAQCPIREYLILEFAEGTTVYVPATNIDMVQKYIGPSELKPYLSKLGSAAWGRRKLAAQEAINDMASDLISMQAMRASISGIACKEDDELQKEFEAAFIYQETEDQLIAASQIKKDIESPRPMDRLICGDVGYGKTELAMRAAFKIVMNGRQVAMLVPTTILAQQHYETFSERLADYPVRVDVLSRFRSKKEQKDILEMAATGTVDIVIGTHRLVQKDVHFKDIGLVIIDEEQKFGVKHKERLKQLRQVVDILTLTATPIPRTLHMAMLGVRDISSLNTPPMDRKAIQTRVIRFRHDLIRQIIIHELNRNGQVFFVHNRVYNIERIAAIVEDLAPEARVAIVHGQMAKNLMESRMRAFVCGKIDILVATTIIESGLDIPNVNTILINDADTFGLADLHQLRGRVGRYKHRAFAYLILPLGRPVTPEAEKKLKAIEEFSSLGAGFKIALRDLEIRGAGNFLGSEQHGHIAAVGYEMYCRLLESTIKRLQKQPVPQEINVTINVGLDAYLPNDYIAAHTLKMEVYKQLAKLQHVGEIADMTALLRDRFGPLPGPAINLMTETEVKIAAFYVNIKSISRLNGDIIIEHTDCRNAEKALISVKDSLRTINSKTIQLRPHNGNMTPKETILFLKDIFVSKQE